MNDFYDCTKTGLGRSKSGRCVHEACRPQGPISEELKRMDQAEPDVLPGFRATVRFGPAVDGVPLDFKPPYEITVTGPAAFVAHVVTAAADAFEEDAQR